MQSLCETPHHLKSARCWSWGRASGIASSGSGYVVEIDSLERPLRLLHDWREGLYGIEELVPLVPILDVAGVDVEALHFTRDVLRHYLEAVKASRLGNLDMYNVTMILGFNLSSILFIFDFKQKCETAYPASLMKIKIVLKVFFLVAQYFSAFVDWKVPRLWARAKGPAVKEPTPLAPTPILRPKAKVI